MSTTSTGSRRLTRNRDDAMLGGVCAGVADHLGLDVTLVRILAVLGAVFGFGSLVVAYVVAWMLMPEA
jgi:phage shock protein PspC (stress-responsive transcriptional regulator)